MNLEQAFEKDAASTANCFTVKRFGAVAEGIELSLDQGPDQEHPWVPHVKVGGWRVQRDSFRGCVYTVNPSGTGLVRRASLKTCVSKLKQVPFNTLVNPEVEKMGFSLVKVDLRLPGAKSGVVVKNRQLKLYFGSRGGSVIEGDGYEAVIQLAEGEKLMLFFEDGAVRCFIREGMVVEQALSVSDQLRARIDQAWSQLEANVNLPAENSQKAMVWTLRGMVDLINLTSVYEQAGIGQELRLTLMRNFFLKLSLEMMELVHPKLMAALYLVDSALVDVLHGEVSAEVLPAGVADLDQVRRRQERAVRESQRRARQLERSQQGPAKGSSSGGKKVQCTNPKELAKRERKLAQRRG